MRTRLVLIATAAAVVMDRPLALGQEWDNDGGGNIFCEPVPAPQSVNIGDGTTVNLATLNVRGDQMPVADPLPPQAGSLGTFRTDVSSATSQSWTMQRDVLEIGKIWNESIQLAFHVQSFEPRDDGQDRYSGLMLHNEARPDWSGLWIMNDGTPTGGRAFPDPLQTIDAVGYAGLGFIPAMRNTGLVDPRGPWSRFHLFHNVTGTRPLFAHRPQMRNGITLTGNSDHAYVGHWYDQGTSGTGAEVDDNSNLVLSTAEDALPSGVNHHWDNISFRFFSDLAGSDGPASTVRGLEMLRIRPYRLNPGDPITGNVGIGDFLTAATGPEERLDVLDGNVRIRALASAPLSTRMVVADNNGVLGWQTIPGGGGGSCQWSMSGVNNDVSTAFNANTCPPQGLANVAIGEQAFSFPGAKLTVMENTPLSGFQDMAIIAKTTGDEGVNYGIYTTCNESLASVGQGNYGIRADAWNGQKTKGAIINTAVTSGVTGVTEFMGIHSKSDMASASSGTVYGHRNEISITANAPTLYGTFALARVQSAAVVTTNVVGLRADATSTGTSSATNLIGVQGNAQAQTGTNVTYAKGVVGSATGTATTIKYSIYGVQPSPLGANDYSGYFESSIKVGALVYPSDDELKINEEPITDGLIILDQLQPKHYDYDVNAYPTMHLNTGPQMGLIAQELETVLPGLVHSAHQPAEMDSTGNVITPGVDYKGIDYIGLIPVLIAVAKDQQAQIADLQDQINGCCNEGMAPQGGEGNGIGYIDNTQTGPATTRQLNADELVVTPNPFTENPTISYRIGTGGRAQLRVTSASSRDMGVLFDAGTEAGQYSMVWNTEGMAPGLYLLTLTVDGKRVTEQAVKVE